MPQRTYDLSDGHLLTFRTRNQHHCSEYFIWVLNRIEHVRYKIPTSTCRIDIDMFYYKKQNTAGDPIIMRGGLGSN
jgi:hypothetical protein